MVASFLSRMKQGHFQFQRRGLPKFVALAVTALLVLTFLLMLPLLLLLGLIGLVITLIMGKSVSEQHKKMWRHYHDLSVFPGATNRRRNQTGPDSKRESEYSGRTFEHQPDRD
ncbi:hypothetical protein [Paraferrimonas sedimenticola]|uniref:DUF3742 family protein n=1 Tax=Paraferrimonas sedimenticola TaxID=375674 RepID=A0AA37RZ26_9GAMM|nr:hypothetical protein [Paraferrimonas sedimenticola]GLP97831.1 hypothetical protein GCM10007895_31380 [Paraferrimonas sedimenticola]